MLTIVAVVLALTVVPSPWGWVLVLGAFAVDVGETLVLRWWSRRRRASVGVETLVGRSAVVVTTLAPTGHVHVDGETWRARIGSGVAEPGAEVVIRGVDGLLLDVERL